MSITVSDINTELNTIIGDSSTDRITAAERLQFATEAVVWAQINTLNDHQVRTFDLDYFDTVNYYKLNNSLTDVLEANDLRRKVGKNKPAFERQSSQEVSEDIDNQFDNSTYAIERRDGNAHLVINHESTYPSMLVSSMDSLTESGSWAVDATNSDAVNLDITEVDFTQGAGAFTFDIDVSQSGNNRATIENSTMDSEDLTDDKNLSSFIMDIKFPDVTYITSVTFYWGSSSTDYYYVTQTADMNGNAFTDGDFITLKFDWLNAPTTGSPDFTAIDYMRIDVNYGASQADMSGIVIDNLRLVRPEKLKFYYTSWNVGTDTNGTQIKKFTATTDVPYFSGQYDKYLYPVAHKAASLAYRALRLYDESKEELSEASRMLAEINNIIPKSVTRETRNFKVRGIRFNRRGGRNFII
jgi:hypothetical protein